MRKKEKLIDKFWDFLKNLVVIIIFTFLLIVSILPEIACWQAVADGDVPWWTFFLFWK